MTQQSAGKHNCPSAKQRPLTNSLECEVTFISLYLEEETIKDFGKYSLHSQALFRKVDNQSDSWAASWTAGQLVGQLGSQLDSWADSRQDVTQTWHW